MANQILTFDSVDLSDYIASWQESAGARINAMSVPKRHGALVSDSIVEEPRIIGVTGRLVSQTSAETLRGTLDTLAELFARRKKRLQLWDDRYVIASKSRFQHGYLPGSSMKAIDFSLEFFCDDPFWYALTPDSSSRTLDSSDTLVDLPNTIYKEAFTLTNNGTVPVFPKITVTAGASVPLTTIVVRNLTTGRQWTYTGTVAVTKALVCDGNTFRVDNDGVEDLANWAGDFTYLQAGNNSMEIEGKVPATYLFEWSKRWY
jgi:phage-related protein